MSVFIDTSAFYALLDSDDLSHSEAKSIWVMMRKNEDTLITHNYVLVETAALLQRKISVEAVRAFRDHIMPLITTVWVDVETHEHGLTALLASRKRHVSFVDWISFEVIRKQRCKASFAFDEDFELAGVPILKSPEPYELP